MTTPHPTPGKASPPPKATTLNGQQPGKRAETELTRPVAKPFFAVRSNPETHPQRAITAKGIEEASNYY